VADRIGKGKIQWKILLSGREDNGRGDVQFVTASLVLAGNRLYPVNAVENYEDLTLFNSVEDEADSDKVLSLFAGYFPDLKILFFDYEVIASGRIPVEPALLLEDVDSAGTLFLNIRKSAEEVDTEFLNSYDISRIARINDEDKTIHISSLLNPDISRWNEKIAKKLKKHSQNSPPEMQFNRIDDLFLVGSALASRFLESELHDLLSDFVLLGSEKLKKFKIRPVTPKISLKIASGINFLEGNARIHIDDEEFDLLSMLTSYEKDHYILLADGTRGVVNHKFFNRLKRLLKPGKDGNFKLSFFDLPLIQDLIDEKTAGKDFLRSKEILQGFNSLHQNPPPLPQLTAPLRDYQIKGYNWLSYLGKNDLGGCLADDMGLGKTIQAIALLATEYGNDKKSSLIIMPMSLLFNWQREVRRFAPSLSTSIYHGPDRDLEKSLQSHLILTTYAITRQDIELLSEKEFHYIILDESQNIKNISSKVSRAVMLLKGEKRLALSGTPIENNLSELYALFRFLNPAMFGSVRDFQRDYFTPVIKEGDEHALSDLKKKIYPFLLRRLKGEVLNDLPEKTEQTIFVEMSREQEQIYESRRRFYYDSIKMKIVNEGIENSRLFLFQALNELRQITGFPRLPDGSAVENPKKDVLIDQLKDVIANSHKALVFSNYLEALHIIEEELQEKSIKCLKITGKTKKRDQIVDSFQNDEDCSVLLMTLKTGGVGLNLTAAEYVFIYDPWWNASAENQAVDRAHRIGQKNSVFSYKLICRNTIEEKILQLQQNKTELVNALIDSDSRAMKSLSEDDIEYIFSSTGMGD
jgi:SNF2 family DNA or RNA helicase